MVLGLGNGWEGRNSRRIQEIYRGENQQDMPMKFSWGVELGYNRRLGTIHPDEVPLILGELLLVL